MIMPKYITIHGNFNINDKVITTKFGYIKNPKNTSCPISCDDFKPEDNVIKINKCGHIVSKAELKDWFMINKSCPLCNYNIEYDNYDEPIRCFKTAPYNIKILLMLILLKNYIILHYKNYVSINHLFIIVVLVLRHKEEI